jgi:hypothetical protein
VAHWSGHGIAGRLSCGLQRKVGGRLLAYRCTASFQSALSTQSLLVECGAAEDQGRQGDWQCDSWRHCGCAGSPRPGLRVQLFSVHTLRAAAEQLSSVCKRCLLLERLSAPDAQPPFSSSIRFTLLNPCASLNPFAPPHPSPGAITATVVCPLDVLKTRLQVQGKAGAAMYRGVGGEFLLRRLPPHAHATPSGAHMSAAAAANYSYEAVAAGGPPSTRRRRLWRRAPSLFWRGWARGGMRATAAGLNLSPLLLVSCVSALFLPQPCSAAVPSLAT